MIWMWIVIGVAVLMTIIGFIIMSVKARKYANEINIKYEREKKE